MRRWSAAAAATLAALLLAGCSWLPDGTDGNLTNDWPALPAAASFTPTSGACHKIVVEGEKSDSWQPVPCGATHLSETAAVGRFTGATATATKLPKAGSAAERQAYQECSKRATAFVGGPWRTGRIVLRVLLPSQDAWTGGARWYRCELAEIKLDTEEKLPRKRSMARGLQGEKSLRLGCSSSKITDSVVEAMTPVACTKKHNAEFAGLWTVPKGVSYGDMQTQARTAKGCLSVIATFVGVPDDSRVKYRTGWISDYPGREEWNLGNRQVQCFLYTSHRRLTRSLKGGGGAALPIQYG